MPKHNITEAISIKGRFYEQHADGSFRPLEGQTDWERVNAMTEEEIEAAALNDPDNPPLTDEDWQKAVKVSHKRYIHIGVDDDVLDWFKSQGTRGYQTKINSVLRQYVEAQRKAG